MLNYFLTREYTIISLIIIRSEECLERRNNCNLISIPFAQLSSGLISLIVVTNAQLEIWLFI